MQLDTFLMNIPLESDFDLLRNIVLSNHKNIYVKGIDCQTDAVQYENILLAQGTIESASSRCLIALSSVLLRAFHLSNEIHSCKGLNCHMIIWSAIWSHITEFLIMTSWHKRYQKQFWQIFDDWNIKFLFKFVYFKCLMYTVDK